MGEDRLLWMGVGQSMMGDDRTGLDVLGWCRIGVSASPGQSLLSRSPGHDPHHGAAGVAGGGEGDTSVPDLLGDWPAGARVPVVLWEAGGEVPLRHVKQSPQGLSMARAPRRVGGSPRLLGSLLSRRCPEPRPRSW